MCPPESSKGCFQSLLQGLLEPLQGPLEPSTGSSRAFLSLRNNQSQQPTNRVSAGSKPLQVSSEAF